MVFISPASLESTLNVVVKLVVSSFKAINFIIDGLQLLHKLVELVEIVDLGILRTDSV